MVVWETQSVFPSDGAGDLDEVGVDLLWRWVIVEANVNFSVAVAVREAPLEFFLGMDSSRWLLVRLGQNALRQAALSVINALTDPTKGSLTLNCLRQWALELCVPALRTSLEQYQAA